MRLVDKKFKKETKMWIIIGIDLLAICIFGVVIKIKSNKDIERFNNNEKEKENISDNELQ